MKTNADAMLRVFLSFKAAYRNGAVPPLNGQHIERAVKDLFMVIPTPAGARDGSLKGTISLRGTKGNPHWLSNESYRGSVQDYAGPTSPGRVMFEVGDWRQPMLPQALRYLVETLGDSKYAWPKGEALTAIVLRNDALDPNFSWSDLEALAIDRFGLEGDEWAAITSRQPMDVEPFDGPEWDPNELASYLRPNRSKGPATAMPSSGTASPGSMPVRLEEEVERVVSALEVHGGSAIVALAGVPGTSKSHVARLAARQFASSGCLREIQFSPGYTYEEFMEGPRYGEGMEVEILPGAFLELNGRALADSKSSYVLLIEEFTRADLPRVLGELLTFIEYRDQSAMFTTLYERKKSTRIAPNLAVLATYNPSDRSAINVDAALIRRMRILDFPPDMDLLREILLGNGVVSIVVEKLVAMFDACRQAAGERFSESMPFGHAIFSQVRTEEDLHYLWHEKIRHMLVRPHAPKHELYSTIEEHYPWRYEASYTLGDVNRGTAEAVQGQLDVRGIRSTGALDEPPGTGP